MTEREKFDDWAEANGFGQRMGGVLAIYEPDVFKAGDHAFEIWQASRKQALEEAIEEAEGSAKAYMGYARGSDNSGASDHKADALIDFVEELRALANPEGEQG